MTCERTTVAGSLDRCALSDLDHCSEQYDRDTGGDRNPDPELARPGIAAPTGKGSTPTGPRHQDAPQAFTGPAVRRIAPFGSARTAEANSGGLNDA